MLNELLLASLKYNGERWLESSYTDSKGRGNWTDDQAAFGFAFCLRWLYHRGVHPNLNEIGVTTL